ncbi:phosphotransferase family protein [Bacillaceae bacterium W0354]
MEHVLGGDWSITPAGGTTGEAFLAQNDNEKLFLKRNSSPFIAVLSAEGIVPKLVWTKRLENGDVITAQKWLEGRVLTKSEMRHEKVTKLLSKIHHSPEILHLFMRMGKKPKEPSRILIELINKCRKYNLFNKEIFVRAIEFLSRKIIAVEKSERVVCHSDINHENYLFAEDEQLYLVDWDQALIADPALDLSVMLYQYIHRSEWEDWLHQYGLDYNENLQMRIDWFMIAQSINNYIWHFERDELSISKLWEEQLVHYRMILLK